MAPADEQHADDASAPEGLAAETELKFVLGAGDLRKLAKHPLFAAPATAKRMTSVYYDTAAFDLHRHKVSLRVRRVDGRFVQTVKRLRLGDVFDRDEWEATVRRQAFDAQALEGTPVAKLLRKADAAVLPVFRSVFTRQVRTFVYEGAVIEIAIDRGRVQAGEAVMPLAEMEIELKSGEAAELYRLARELFDLAPIRLSLTSKSERGYRLLAPSVVSKASKIGLKSDMTVGEAFSAISLACLVQVLEAADVFRRSGAAEGVHQVRVGLRRLRTALKIFEDVVRDGRSDWVEQEVRWLAGELAEARSLDVFIGEAFEPRAASLSDAEAALQYGERLKGARDKAYERVAAALASPRFATLALEIALWIEDGAWRDPTAAKRRDAVFAGINDFAARVLEELRNTVIKRARGFEKQDAPSRHKLRIRAKRMRYASDFFGQLYTDDDAAKKHRRFNAALKPLQTALGRLNDIATAPQIAVAPLNGAASEVTFTAGELVGQLQQPAAKTLQQACAALDDFKDAKRFWPKPQAPEKEQAPPD
jgi:inorganic triphosphatase YgiF